MPELPEVETVRRGLERLVVGRRIADVTVTHPRAVRRHAAGPADFASRLAGRRVRAARRRGKYLWFPLDSGDALLGHLGMSGQLLVVPAAAPAGPHLRVRFTFADAPAGGAALGTELRFVDQRTFGGLSVVPDGEPPPAVAHIALDPLDPDFDDAGFAVALRRRHTEIKRALLDQNLVSGIGNIYADEALWRARLHFARRTATLRPTDVTRLLAALRAVLGEALTAGGTSFDSLYVDVNGESGRFDRSLDVYGRGGQPCRRCGTPLRRDPFMNRSSYSCPRCQPRPRRPRRGAALTDRA
ncbi:MAG TPA: bifunctional DNA-formamidopyrimidine glycosylase/DNA-(apurinic or apyrimidinic site) lyase [Mycobacteriales bacterium]|nr:bifunctional DNA-formamidopyrimidine glycosylase/DNA-(apurinic or apyrimidinic site) lyase [Mycobacteriales bacterium]